MPGSDFKHSFSGAGNKPAAEMTLTYPQENAPGQIALHLSDALPAGDSKHVADEAAQLADALQFKIIPDKSKPNALVIETGDRSPDGLGLYISSHLAERKLIDESGKHRFMEALTRHEEAQHAAPEKTVDPMKAAMQHTDMAAALEGLKQSRAVLTPTSEEHDPVRERASTDKRMPAQQAGGRSV